MHKPTPETLRVELARHRIQKSKLALRVGMLPSQLSAYLSGSKPMHEWAAHNLGVGMNLLTGHMIFRVDMKRPLMSAKPGPVPRMNPVARLDMRPRPD